MEYVKKITDDRAKNSLKSSGVRRKQKFHMKLFQDLVHKNV